MTENEAIIQLNFDMEMIRFDPSTGEYLTLEQIKTHNEDNYKTYLADELAITALLEIQQYRAIGTIEEFKALKENQRKCEDCAGCTAWNCDCANERAKAIDEFAEKIALETSESIIWDMLATMSKNGSLSDTSDKIVDYVIDTSKKIAEQMKGGAE